MSLTVKHLNGDTTFLLTFAPSLNPVALPAGPQRQQQPQGTFTILVDPWLSGPCSMFHPKFLLSKHTTESCIESLSQIPEPNIVLVSQDKPDHCHEATLRQLDPKSSITTILAEPGAYKKIRSMKYFSPQMIHPLRTFSSKDPDSVIKFFIPPIVSGGTAGEATISFVPAKKDIAGVHNAIGVTYRPPSAISMRSRPFSSPSSSGHSTYPYSQNFPVTPPESPSTTPDILPPSSVSHTRTTSASTSRPSDTFSASVNYQSVTSLGSSIAFDWPFRAQTEKSLSFLYSPHGVDYSLIHPFASSHLIASAALPLTLLLHSFDRVNNPWWMGGNVAAGMPGGVEIAQNLMVRCWVSAHDEDKDNSGLSVKNVTKQKFTAEEVAEMCQDRVSGGNTSVLNLGVGEEIILRG